MWLVVELSLTTNQTIVESGEDFLLSRVIKNIYFDTCSMNGSGTESIDLQNENSVVLSLLEGGNYEYQLTCGERTKTISISCTKNIRAQV